MCRQSTSFRNVDLNVNATTVSTPSALASRPCPRLLSSVASLQAPGPIPFINIPFLCHKQDKDMSRAPLSLKQRLAALASAPTAGSRSDPSSSNGASGSRQPHARKRSMFMPPWVKRSSASMDGAVCGNEERDRVQDVMGRMIYQAGACFLVL
jgi:hypothetical protein